MARRGPGVKHVLTPQQIEDCARYAGVGLNYDQMAGLCDMCPATFDEVLKRQPEVKQAIEKGRSKGVGGIANTLYQQAMSGNITAAIFYLKTRARWAEARPEDADNAPKLDTDGANEFSLNYKK